MPQMAPISWLILFVIFSITFILFNIMNYYNTLPKSKNLEINENNKINTNSLNWKW